MSNNNNQYANLNFGKCKFDEIDLGNGKCAVSFNPCKGNNQSTTGYCTAWGYQQKVAGNSGLMTGPQEENVADMHMSYK